MFRPRLLWLWCAVFAVGLAGCGKSGDPRLVGKWQGKAEDPKLSEKEFREARPTHYFDFEANGNLTYSEPSRKDKVTGLWKVTEVNSDDMITIRYGPVGAYGHVEIKFDGADRFTMKKSTDTFTPIIFDRASSK